MAKCIETWTLDRLLPYARNPRTHSPEQVDKIARSIDKFGFNVPILVDENSGILAGHGRLMAARKLGLRTVPVIVLTHLSEDQKRAFLLADNRIAQDAGWDDELLAGELKALEEEAFDLTLTGFDEDEIADLLAPPGGDSESPPSPSEIKLGVFVNCTSSRQQKKVLALLEERGYECRAVN